MPAKNVSIKFNKYSRQLKSLFKIYAYFENILTKLENKENKADESCTDKCQDHIARSYAFKSVYRINKLEIVYLGKESVFNFISKMTEEVKYCEKIVKKEFYKEILMRKKMRKI